jgi:DNA-binding transcriptional LysR family regulator
MLDELREFLLVAAHGTFTEAARRAHLSQPALSAAIARLEESFGARLFERGRGGARLTAAGAALLPRARAALAAIDEARRAVAEVLDLRAGEVRLGGGATVCSFYLPPLCADFRRDHPGIVLKLREAMTPAVREAVTAGELDLGLVTDPAGEHWFDDEMIVVASPATNIATAPFVSLPPGSATRQLVERHFPDANVVMELSGLSAVVAFVRAGVGIALVSRAAVAADLAAGALVAVRRRGPRIVRPLHLIHRGAARLPPAAAALRQRILASRPRA